MGINSNPCWTLLHSADDLKLKPVLIFPFQVNTSYSSEVGRESELLVSSTLISAAVILLSMISCCDVAHCLLSMIRPMFLLVSSHALTSSPLFTHHLKFSDRLLISNSQKPACNAWRIRKKVESPSSSNTDWQPPPLQCCTCRRQRRQQKAAATDVHLRPDTLVFLPGNWCLSIPLLMVHRQKHQRTTLWTN